VAILSSESFSAPEVIDQSSLTFGHAGTELSLHVRGDSQPNCEGNDVNSDGFLDLVCHFYTQLAAFQDSDRKGFLRGSTNEGAALLGNDDIRIVGRGHDADNDWTKDEDEDTGPNDGDGYNDGILDSLQGNVTTIRSIVSGHHQTITVGEECMLHAVTTLHPEAVLEDAAFTKPEGLLAFIVERCEEAKVTILYHGAEEFHDARYRKLGEDAWYNLPAQIGIRNVNGQLTTVVAFTLIDGGLGDSDYQVNGRIVDPGGLAVLAANQTAIPMLSVSGTVALIALLMVAGLGCLLRRMG
jgi:hypothetical protein